MPPRIVKAKDLKKYQSGTFLKYDTPKYNTVNAFNRKLMELRERLSGQPGQSGLAEQAGKYSGALMALQMHEAPVPGGRDLDEAIMTVSIDLPYFLKTKEKGGEEKTGYQRLLEAGQEHGLFTREELDEVLTLVGDGMGVALGQDEPRARQQPQQQPQARQQPPPKPFRQALDRAVDGIDTEKEKPAPRFDDLSIGTNHNAAWDYSVPVMRAQYRETALSGMIVKELRALPKEKQEEFFEKAIGPDADRERVKDRFFGINMRSGNPRLLMDNKYWGRTSNRQMLDALEAVLPPEKLQAMGESAEKLVAPDEPGYTGPFSSYPDREKVEKLRRKEQETLSRRKEERQAVLDAQANIALLDRVDEQLSVIDPEYREYMNGYTRQVDNPNVPKDLNTMTDWTCGIITLQGVKSLQGGRFDGTIKSGKEQTKQQKKNEGFIVAAYDKDQQGKVLSDAEVRELRGIRPPLSEATVNAAQKYFDGLKKLDYSKNGEVVKPSGRDTFFKEEKPDDLRFIQEQGTKYYTYWPLIEAKTELREAVESGDMEKIRAASEKYQKVDDTIGEMTQAVGDPKLGGAKIFDGNVNSTRSATPAIPAKYIRDYATHNKVNSLFCLNIAAHNLHADPMDLVRDPANTILKMGKAYTDHRGIDASSSIGGKLCWGMQAPVKDSATGLHYENLERDWDEYMVFPAGRGLSGLLGMEGDPKKRAEYAALFNLGAVAATQSVAREAERFQTMTDIATGKAKDARQKRDLLYQNAALLPADKFSMGKIADTFGDGERPDRWKKDLSVDELTTGENIRKLDLRELAARNQAIIREHDAQREKGAFLSGVNTDEYLKSAFRAHVRILKNAPEDVRAGRDYRTFANSVKQMPALAKSPDTKALLAAGLKSLEEPEFLNTLKTDKSDRLFGKTDSEEYTDMKNSLQSVKDHLRILTEGPKDNDEYRMLQDWSFSEKLKRAKEDAFNYASLRTKAGTKTRFSAKSGALRVEESLRTFQKLRELEDQAGLRTPAQKQYDETRLALLSHRSDKTWMRVNGAEAIARIVHAKRFMNAAIPGKDQASAFEPGNWQQEYGKLKNCKEYREFIKASGSDLDAMAESALTNGESFWRVTSDLGRMKSIEYRNQTELSRKEQARENYARYWAMEAAADKLQICTESRFLHADNPEIQAEAERVRSSDGFSETLEYLSDGLKEDDMPGETPDKLLGKGGNFWVAGGKLKYEKKAAEIAVSKVMGERLSKLDPALREGEKQKQISLCRKDPAFRRVIKEKLDGISMKKDMDVVLEQLNEPEKQEELWADISRTMSEEMKRSARAKERPQAPEQAPEQAPAESQKEDVLRQEL